MSTSPDFLIVGAGIFGLTTALDLHRRGYRVVVIDQGTIPHPDAASTDISKIVRMEYGADEQYMAMVEAALPIWRQWNEDLGETLFHETGVAMLTQQPMVADGFEYESYQLLLKRGHTPERMDAAAIRERFPAWKPGAFVDGYYHAQGGYAESGRVVAALAQHARSLGIPVREEGVATIVRANGRATGVRTRDGEMLSAGHVIVAAGTWTQALLPELAGVMKTTGHPVFHIRTNRTDLFTPPHFPVFTADVSRTGWYGFPINPRHDVVKVANHGKGVLLDPVRDAREVYPEDKARLRRFLAATFPDLADAPVVYTRRCCYGDTLDEHFWIDRHPEFEGLTVAAGGSGHGFKMGPVLGPLIADAAEGKPHPWLAKFRWRTLSADTIGQEAARYHG